ncbi:MULTISPECIES: sigma-70 family RNA polymerase sigma factor [Pseudothermotoga]|uniref:RNA polymerase, sigma-24 subunit, ECF subfamily n=1 Tax=Pseudothermotoga lettingae (strain ATCC BAA-301 / DSM 14385 / NBRC 107922 / TMO) TaxID=416591 RepID=A8F7S6_PSELT|nr:MULTISPECIES: sigma-70 family RNA polymerase sigma factor [Pseudothermotoga]ABV34210.1 RNA polymerase, sigma-24 subunit, ECF subfamily [Pseudothermotoga lettingae TMO]KUK21132.1 MAG: RNA polymerase, sigma-24 subunit, ECF subfamily [Pseudothermotoga lettingae]MDI3494482.1 polymerase sporulation-specific sigma factor [Pseudothermotoga sp.]MDK2884816.1 polymerase sporulation-specific sigma factor [Pseudothermotoga sp.]GLI48846.1 DNA-directed RNA polymerase sigma-70 factor [Pseudothermotoga let
MNVKYSLRTKRTEELVNLAQSGLKEALDLLVEKFYPMVVKISSKYYAPWAEFQDLVQNGLVGLIKAVYYYQSDKGGFTSFAWTSVESELKSFLTFLNRRKNRMLTDALSVDSITDEESDETGYSFEDAGTSTVRQAVLEIVMEKVNGHLTDLEQGIISMWINGSSYEQIEQELNVNFKKVDNTVQKFKRIVKTKIDPLLITIFFQN